MTTTQTTTEVHRDSLNGLIRVEFNHPADAQGATYTTYWLSTATAAALAEQITAVTR